MVGGLCVSRFVRLAVCALSDLDGWRFGRLAISVVGGVSGWRFAVGGVGGLRG